MSLAKLRKDPRVQSVERLPAFESFKYCLELKAGWEIEPQLRSIHADTVAELVRDMRRVYCAEGR